MFILIQKKIYIYIYIYIYVNPAGIVTDQPKKTSQSQWDCGWSHPAGIAAILLGLRGGSNWGQPAEL